MKQEEATRLARLRGKNKNYKQGGIITTEREEKRRKLDEENEGSRKKSKTNEVMPGNVLYLCVCVV